MNSNPYYKQAVEIIESGRLNELPAGKHVIDGDNLWVSIIEGNLKDRKDARLEVHDKYIDIQVPLSAKESFGIKKRSECKSPVGEMDTVKDVLFFSDQYDEIVSVEAGGVIVFAPEQAHAPMIGEGPIRKAVFKVKVV